MPAPKIQPRVPRGMRDILPQQMIKRQYVMDTMCRWFEAFGFEPLQTPVLEMRETLMGKYGHDIVVSHLDEKEMRFTQDSLKLYKELGPTIWHGDL